MKRHILALGILVSGLSNTHGISILQTEVYNGSTYHLIGQSSGPLGLRWYEAEAYAVSIGGHLVTINDEAENTFVFETFGSGFNVGAIWLGYNDIATEGDWQWTGEFSTYENWNAGEPNNQGNREDFGTMWGSNTVPDGVWNDIHDINNNAGRPFLGLVEKREKKAAVPDNGTSLVMGIIGLVSLMAIRNRPKRA